MSCSNTDLIDLIERRKQPVDDLEIAGKEGGF